MLSHLTRTASTADEFIECISTQVWLSSSIYPQGMGCMTTFPMALLVFKYANASTVSENAKGLLGSNIGFTFPLSKYGSSFFNTVPSEMRITKIPEGLPCAATVTTFPFSLTAFNALSISLCPDFGINHTQLFNNVITQNLIQYYLFIGSEFQYLTNCIVHYIELFFQLFKLPLCIING